MDPFDIRKQEQQQLEQILKQTFPNTDYVDDDIDHLINDPSGAYQQMFGYANRRQSIQSNKSYVSEGSSRKKSQSGSQRLSQEYYHRESFGSLNQLYDKQNQSYLEQQKNGFIDAVDQDDKKSIKTSQDEFEHEQSTRPQKQINLPQSFQRLEQYYRKYKNVYTLPQIKQKYPYFAISQPSYTLSKAYEQNIFQYNTLKNVNIQVMDVGYCAIAQNFRIAIGTDDGRVAIFEKTYTKPVNIFQAFTPKKGKNKNEQLENNIKVTAIQWSQNLQYLAVSSNTKQLKVYQFKQSISIEDKNILRMCKQPIQIIFLTTKQLQNQINYIKFVSQIPFMALINDEDDEIQVLEYKKHFMSEKPYLNKLPVKFNDVFQIQVMDFVVGGDKYNTKNHKNLHNFFNKDKEFIVAGTSSTHKNIKNSNKQQYGTLMAAGSDQYVTIALLKPYFEVIMVYDKDKHGKNIKKQGYSHISFRKQPLGLLIIWDKFAQILDIQIQTLNPLQSRIRSSGTQLMPETTLAGGLVTDTLVYQLSQSGIKIYATANFGDEKDSSKYKQYIYQHPINFFEFPQGIRIQQQLVMNIPTLQVLRLFNSFIKHSNDWLFITTNTSLFSVRIQRYEDFIRNTIENINNWKIGLQLLHDGYLGKYKNYDNMTKEIIVKNIHEYSTKYINFLQMVIDNNNHVADPEDGNRNLLWFQQTTFLFNILIQTEQYEHLLNKILSKLAYNGLGKFITSIEPFVMLHRILRINKQGLELLFQYTENKEIISILLIANIVPEKNQIDLPHMINQIILQHRMFEEMVAINMEFKDYYTPFAVMVSHYETILNEESGRNKKQKNDLEVLTQLRMRSAQSEKSEKSQEEIMEESLRRSRIEVERAQDKTRLRSLISYLTYKIFYKINNNQDIPLYATITQRKKIIAKHKQFLEIFVPLFQASIINILLDSEQQQLALFQYIIPELFKGQCLELINDISNKLFHTDLMTDIVLNIPIEKVKSLRVYWICLISLYNKSVIKMEIFMGLRYLVKEEREQTQKIYEEKEDIPRTPIRNKTSLDLPQKSKKRSKPSMLRSIQKCIKQTVKVSNKKIYEQLKKLSPNLLEQFFNELLSPELDFQQSHIGLLRIMALILGSGFHIRVIHAMMANKSISQASFKHKRKQSVYTNKSYTSSVLRNKKTSILYDFIEETIQKYNKIEKEALKNIIYENVEYFIDLDCDRLCDLIMAYYLEDIDKFVSYNNQAANIASRNSYAGIIIGERLSPSSRGSSGIINPSIQINKEKQIRLVQGLLQRLQSLEIQSRRIAKFESSSEFMLDLRLKYLALLAETGRQHEILAEIKKQNYPLDSSLMICRKFHIVDAEAYLLVKSGGEGEISSAIQLYFKLIRQKIKDISAESIPQFKDYFISIIGECIRVCEVLHSAPDHFNYQWFVISEELNDLNRNMHHYVKPYPQDLLRDIIQKEIYPILAEKIVKNEFCDGIINYLRQNMEELDLIFIQALLEQILKNFAFQKIMFLLTQQTYIQSQLKVRNEITIESSKGFITTGTCFLCQEREGLIIHYNNCGHQIHPSCGQDVKVCIVCALREQKMIEKQIDILKKIKTEVYSGENEQLMYEKEKQKVRKETKMERLKKYDDSKIDIIYI